MASDKQDERRALKRIRGKDLGAIVNAISALKPEALERYDAWKRLAELSSNTRFQGIEAHPDGVFETEANKFEAVANAYVILGYGSGQHLTEMSDTYPARVAGRYESNGVVHIDKVTIDTSSFNE
jgi:hypothetical protein